MTYVAISGDLFRTFKRDDFLTFLLAACAIARLFEITTAAIFLTLIVFE